MSSPAPSVIQTSSLTFHYQDSPVAALRDIEWEIGAGERWLLTGANGAGKTTLLRVIGGKHMIERGAVSVLGRPAFHDTSLAREVAFLGGAFQVNVDIRVGQMIDNSRADPDRCELLREILGVDPDWHMHRISDGQRRRVQLLLGLAHPYRLLLLDEITTDLDLLCRSDLLAFLKAECEERGASILYATHILDRLEGWATHLAFLHQGRLLVQAPMEQLTALAELKGAGVSAPLSHLMERWLRQPDLLEQCDTATP